MKGEESTGGESRWIQVPFPGGGAESSARAGASTSGSAGTGGKVPGSGEKSQVWGKSVLWCPAGIPEDLGPSSPLRNVDFGKSPAQVEGVLLREGSGVPIWDLPSISIFFPSSLAGINL